MRVGDWRFYLANGGIDRQIGIAGFGYLGERPLLLIFRRRRANVALMGETLGGFGFVLDPFRRKLRPSANCVPC